MGTRTLLMGVRLQRVECQSYCWSITSGQNAVNLIYEYYGRLHLCCNLEQHPHLQAILIANLRSFQSEEKCTRVQTCE